MRRSGRWATSWNRSATLKEFGRIEILVNNAGITRDDLAMRMSDEAWADVLNVNLTGAFYMARAVLRAMLKARGGRIINMFSVSGQMGNAGQANCSASKAGLIGKRRRSPARLPRAGSPSTPSPPGSCHRADRRAARLGQGCDQGRNAAGPLRLDRRHRGRRRLPRLRRSGLHHGPGPGRRRRPGDDVRVCARGRPRSSRPSPPVHGEPLVLGAGECPGRAAGPAPSESVAHARHHSQLPCPILR
jgi:short chain dehydrogenase